MAKNQGSRIPQQSQPSVDEQKLPPTPEEPKAPDAPDATPPAPPVSDPPAPTEETAGDEEEASKRIKTSWFADTCTWTVPGYTGEMPSLDTSKLTPNVRNLAFRAGIQAKGVDGAAKKKGTPAAEKVAFINRVIANLIAGKWKGDRGESFGDGILMAAMNELYVAAGKPPMFADVVAYQKFLTDGAADKGCTVDQFISSQEARGKIRPVVDRLRLASLADVKFDADSILDGE